MSQARPGILVLLLLVGCVAPDTAPIEAPLTEPVPARFTAAGPGAPEGRVVDGWWRDFGDPRLDELVELGLERNHDLRAAAQRVRAAAGVASIAGSARWPQLGVSGSVTRTRQVFLGIPIPGAPEPLSSEISQKSIALDLSWEIDLWGRLAAGELAAEADVEAAAADLEAVRLAFIGEIGQLWFRYCEAAMQADLAARTVATFAETERVVAARVEAGFSAKLDLDSASADREAAAATLDARRTEVERLSRALQILVGRYPDGDLEASELTELDIEAVPLGLPIELLRRRPDLVAAERRIAAAGARHFASKQALLPRLTLTGNVGTLGETFSDVADPDFGIWNIAAGLVMPLFTAGRLEGAIARDEALRDELAELYAQRILGAFREVETGVAIEDELLSRSERLYSARSLARSAERAARLRYEEGLVDITRVLVAQRRALEIESAWLAARRDRLINRVELHQALGGGFGAKGES